jgi:hypothetical protein
VLEPAIPVLAALVEVENKILLARNAAWGPKNFALITGFMEVFRQQDIWGGLTRKSAFVLADTPL